MSATSKREVRPRFRKSGTNVPWTAGMGKPTRYRRTRFSTPLKTRKRDLQGSIHRKRKKNVCLFLTPPYPSFIAHHPFPLNSGQAEKCDHISLIETCVLWAQSHKTHSRFATVFPEYLRLSNVNTRLPFSSLLRDERESRDSA